MDASLGFRVGAHILDLAVLQADRVIDLDVDGAQRVAVLGNAVANREVVARVQKDERQERQNGNLRQDLQASIFSQVFSQASVFSLGGATG